MDLYGQLVKKLLYPAWDEQIRRRPIGPRLRWLEQTERAPLHRLQALQARELARLATHAYEHVPHYRAKMRARGVEPRQLTPDTLARLPILTRTDAAASVEARRSQIDPRPTIRKTTGGTTGEPLVIEYDLDSEYWRQAVKLRGYAWAGYQIGEPVVIYWGEPTKPGVPALTRTKIAVDRGLKRESWIDCTPQGDDAMAAAVAEIRRRRPTAFICYAQAGAELARYINRTGARDWAPTAVITGAEKVAPADREALEQAFGPVFETYGCRELMLIGTECAAHDGLHLSMENLIVELVVRNGDDERPARPGEVGEVVVTDLHNLGAPLIRYANGDLAVAAPPSEVCRCGRAHPRLASVEGRSTETLLDADGNRVGGMLFNLAFSPLADKVRQFQAVQHRDRSITLKIVPGPGFDDGVIRHVETSCQRYLPGVSVTPELVDEIPLTTSGKRRIVIVES
jgi:phenylacetate-CoA ligase